MSNPAPAPCGCHLNLRGQGHFTACVEHPMHWPYAVESGIGTGETVWTRFSDKRTAALFADLMDTPGNIVRRWVLVEGTTEYRDVTYFLLADKTC